MGTLPLLWVKNDTLMEKGGLIEIGRSKRQVEVVFGLPGFVPFSCLVFVPF
jgi:hypothetical protein